MAFQIISTLLIAIALAMDAFSVSLTKGFTQKNLKTNQILYYGVFFGFFQFMMPLIGYYIGGVISRFIVSVASIVAFVLLLAIGLNMIRESLDDDEEISDNFSFKEVTLLAIATSIDALAVGLTYAILGEEIILPSIIIGIVAFLFTIAGIFLGKKIGNYFGGRFQILGGVILILIGVKILLGF
ncbi:MAG: manganese efflux pump [Methanobrevibacter sp.]|uniref:manganese efflux pump MntP n=1 Tax=Methanobrevibacter sp. TaxID=66852 RepID=UPI0025F51A0C|nr:manganese efflux pump MntP family protein [Methanobrevibacter sp.]MBR0271002.1 manganese efflux pump [Methanobrevibacter sp.]